jgi:ABC-type uncharacterized transport system substrate-binding protein
MNRATAWILAALCLAASTVAAGAHPHVWVKFRSEVMFSPQGAVTGIRHAWTFDDMFSAYALQGIKHAKKGEYTREELTSLAALNIKSLKEYDYFTYAEEGGHKVVLAAPVDYWLEYRDSTLTLHFTLPLKTPLSTRQMRFEVYDPTIFVDFEFAKGAPVSLAGAPAECRAKTELPHEPTPAEQAKLADLDNNPLDPSSTFGQTFANKIFVTCS